MTRLISLLIVLSILSLSVTGAVSADETGKGTIEGHVVNKTSGGEPVAAQEVTLKTYRDKAEVNSTTTKTNSEGHFVFDELPTGSEYAYQAVTDFQGVEYKSEQFSFANNKTARSIEITVYDSTKSDEAISVVMSHIIVYTRENTLQVKEYYLFANDGNRTYIGESGQADKGVLHFSLPEGATELQGTMGLKKCCIVSTEDGFADTKPFEPGMKEIAYSYRVNPGSDTYTFSRAMNYPVKRLDFLIDSNGVEVTSDQLADNKPLSINGRQYQHLSGKGLTKGEELVIHLSGLPRSSSSSFLWILLAVGVIAVASVSIYLVRSKRRRAKRDESESDKEQRLLAEIASLDNQFEAGDISEETYRKLRAEKKRELTSIMQARQEE